MLAAEDGLGGIRDEDDGEGEVEGEGEVDGDDYSDGEYDGMAAEAADGSADAGTRHTCPAPGCGRVFRRLEHLRRHSAAHAGVRPYACIHPRCGKRFSRLDNLQLHMRKHPTIGQLWPKADD